MGIKDVNPKLVSFLYLKKGWSVSHIAVHLSEQRLTISKCLVAQGIKLRDGNGGEFSYRPVTPPTPEEIIERSNQIQEGWSETTRKQRAGISNDPMTIPTAKISNFSRRKQSSVETHL